MSSPGSGNPISPLQDGQRVVFKGLSATVRFVGEVGFRPGVWVGLELDIPEGKNDGMINDSRYFTCPQNHGVFCKESALLAENNIAPLLTSGGNSSSAVPAAPATRSSPERVPSSISRPAAKVAGTSSTIPSSIPSKVTSTIPSARVPPVSSTSTRVLASPRPVVSSTSARPAPIGTASSESPLPSSPSFRSTVAPSRGTANPLNLGNTTPRASPRPNSTIPPAISTISRPAAPASTVLPSTVRPSPLVNPVLASSSSLLVPQPTGVPLSRLGELVNVNEVTVQKSDLVTENRLQKTEDDLKEEFQEKQQSQREQQPIVIQQVEHEEEEQEVEEEEEEDEEEEDIDNHINGSAPPLPVASLPKDLADIQEPQPKQPQQTHKDHDSSISKTTTIENAIPFTQPHLQQPHPSAHSIEPTHNQQPPPVHHSVPPPDVSALVAPPRVSTHAANAPTSNLPSSQPTTRTSQKSPVLNTSQPPAGALTSTISQVAPQVAPSPVAPVSAPVSVAPQQVQSGHAGFVSKEELQTLQAQMKQQHEVIRGQVEQQFKLQFLELKNAVYCANLERDIKKDEVEIAQLEIEILQEELQFEKQKYESELLKAKADTEMKLQAILSTPALAAAINETASNNNALNTSASANNISSSDIAELKLENSTLMDQLLDAETLNEQLEDELVALKGLRELDRQLIDLDKVLINELSNELNNIDLQYNESMEYNTKYQIEIKSLTNLVMDLRRKVDLSEKEKQNALNKAEALEEEIDLLAKEILVLQEQQSGTSAQMLTDEQRLLLLASSSSHPTKKSSFAPSPRSKRISTKKSPKKSVVIGEDGQEYTVEVDGEDREIAIADHDLESFEYDSASETIDEDEVNDLGDVQNIDSAQLRGPRRASHRIVAESVRRSMGLMKQAQSRALLLAESVEVPSENYSDLESHPAVISLRSKISELRSHVDQKEGEISQKEIALKSRDRELDSVKVLISTLEEKLRESQKRVSNCELTVMNSEMKLRDYENLKNQSEHTTEHVASLTSKLASSLSELNTFKELAANHKKALDEMKEELESKQVRRRGGNASGIGNNSSSSSSGNDLGGGSALELEGLRICLRRATLELQKLQLELSMRDLQAHQLNIPLPSLIEPLPSDHPLIVAAHMEALKIGQTLSNQDFVNSTDGDREGKIIKQMVDALSVSLAASNGANDLVSSNTDLKSASNPNSPNRDARRPTRLSSFAARGSRLSSAIPGAYMPLPHSSGGASSAVGGENSSPIAGAIASLSSSGANSGASSKSFWNQFELECLPAWQRLAIDRLKQRVASNGGLMATASAHPLNEVALNANQTNQSSDASKTESSNFSSDSVNVSTDSPSSEFPKPSTSAMTVSEAAMSSMLAFQSLRREVLLAHASCTVIDLDEHNKLEHHEDDSSKLDGQTVVINNQQDKYKWNIRRPYNKDSNSSIFNPCEKSKALELSARDLVRSVLEWQGEALGGTSVNGGASGMAQNRKGDSVNNNNLVISSRSLSMSAGTSGNPGDGKPNNFSALLSSQSASNSPSRAMLSGRNVFNSFGNPSGSSSTMMMGGSNSNMKDVSAEMELTPEVLAAKLNPVHNFEGLTTTKGNFKPSLPLEAKRRLVGASCDQNSEQQNGNEKIDGLVLASLTFPLSSSFSTASEGDSDWVKGLISRIQRTKQSSVTALTANVNLTSSTGSTTNALVIPVVSQPSSQQPLMTF